MPETKHRTDTQHERSEPSPGRRTEEAEYFLAESSDRGKAKESRGGFRPWRAGVRFLASVMLTSGALLIAEAAVTVLWQEPLTTLFSERGQAKLEQELATAERDAGKGESRSGSQRELAAAARKYGATLNKGDAVGRLRIPRIGKKYPLIEGTDIPTLRSGSPGHYGDTPLPGQRGTVGVAAHRTTYGAPFRHIDKLRRGDPIIIAMPYGRFTYEVEETRIVDPTDVWVKRRVGYNRLILSACHPPYSAAQRIVVFARLVRTPR